MLESEKSFHIKKPVLLLKTLSTGHLAVIDAHTSLRLIDPNSYKVVSGFKTNIVHERYIGTHVDIAHGGGICASILPKSNQAALFSIAKKSVLYKVGRHQGEVESIAIDPNGKYFVTGGQDGKTFAWSLKSARLSFTLPPHSDYVTTIAFSGNGQWLATGSYDKSVTVQNLATMRKPYKLRAHSGAVIKVAFLPSFRLLSLDKEGGVIVWDLKKGKLLKRLPRVNDSITDIVTSPDYKFLFVSTKLGYIALYDLESYEILTQKYLKFDYMITALGFIEKNYRLAIGTVEGDVEIYPLFGDQEHYMQLISQQKYRDFYAEVERNPILTYSDAYKSAERMWEASLMKAKSLLMKLQKEQAEKYLEPFKQVPSKNKLINILLKDFTQYELFQRYVKEGRYNLAYPMVAQFASFKETDTYRELERIWKKRFVKAQELLMNRNGEEEARKVLAPFRGVTDKAKLIAELFEQYKQYAFFKKLVGQKNFAKVFELVKTHPFLKEFEEYQSVLEYGDKIYIAAQRAYMNGEYPKAMKLISMLEEFPDYKDEVAEMQDAIKAKRLFYDAVNSGNLKNAFSYLSSYPLLYETPEGAALEEEWSATVDEALRYASKGDVAGLKKILEKYLDIDAKYEAIATLFKQCYNVQLEQALREKRPADDIERGIRNYLAQFGIDDFIEYYIERYNKVYRKHFSAENETLGNIELWTPKAIVESILDPRV